MSKLPDYIHALTNLYGLVHKDKVLEIYNLQNEEKLGQSAIDDVIKQGVDFPFIEVVGDYFVHETIYLYEEIAGELAKRKGKPFYIPEQAELLKYADDYYSEETQELHALESYVCEHFYGGDEWRAAGFAEDMQGVCQYAFSMDMVTDTLKKHKINLKNQKQASEVMGLIFDLANNTRLWENNGHTPVELARKMGREQPKPFSGRTIPVMPNIPGIRVSSGNASKKTGRNEPCPCGSGKKYKKCCGA